MRELRGLVRASGIGTSQDFGNAICMCTICSYLLKNGVNGLTSAFGKTNRKPFGNSFRDYPTQEVYKLSRFHFLSNRHAEIQEVNKAGKLGSLLDQLKDSYSRFQPRLSSDLSYLIRWSDALR